MDNNRLICLKFQPIGVEYSQCAQCTVLIGSSLKDQPTSNTTQKYYVCIPYHMFVVLISTARGVSERFGPIRGGRRFW